VAVGQTAELNSGASIDLTSEGFNSNWSFVTRPEGSNATINNANSDVATFVPDVTVDYLGNNFAIYAEGGRVALRVLSFGLSLRF